MNQSVDQLGSIEWPDHFVLSTLSTARLVPTGDGDLAGWRWRGDGLASHRQQGHFWTTVRKHLARLPAVLTGAE